MFAKRFQYFTRMMITAKDWNRPDYHISTIPVFQWNNHNKKIIELAWALSVATNSIQRPFIQPSRANQLLETFSPRTFLLDYQKVRSFYSRLEIGRYILLPSHLMAIFCVEKLLLQTEFFCLEIRLHHPAHYYFTTILIPKHSSSKSFFYKKNLNGKIFSVSSPDFNIIHMFHFCCFHSPILFVHF